MSPLYLPPVRKPARGAWPPLLTLHNSLLYPMPAMKKQLVLGSPGIADENFLQKHCWEFIALLIPGFRGTGIWAHALCVEMDGTLNLSDLSLPSQAIPA